MRLAHLNLSIVDLDAALRFYRDLLGLTVLPRPAGLAREGAWLSLGGGIELHLSIDADSDNARSKRHVAFEVKDLDHWRARLVEAGYSIDDRLAERRLFVRDPAGNRIELYAT